MLSTSNLSLQFGKQILFNNVNIKFSNSSCYGVIGANGAGKSTFLKILTSEISPTSGDVILEKNKRISFLKQDHFEYDNISLITTTIMGHKDLFELMRKKEEIYAKPDFNEEDGMKAANMEKDFEEMDGWSAEANAGELLSGLGIKEQQHEKLMKDIDHDIKVKVLLAQAIFGNPDLLILDEPTNNLDLKTITWLEDFLLNFKNLVIVVSHNRNFLDTICTNIVDIDFKKISVFTGNYSFWHQSSQLLIRQRKTANKKAEDKRKELQEFIARFSANASKSRQATSRKKLLEKINIDEMSPSSRKYPAIIFEQVRESGDQVLEVQDLSYINDNGEEIFTNLNFTMNKGDKIFFTSQNQLSVTTLFNILNGDIKQTSGSFKYGQTIKNTYLPNDHNHFFNQDCNIIDWLAEYSTDNDDVYLRGFLGKMLFSGEDVFKKINVLSGGEKVRCMLSRMMLLEGNLLSFDNPTDHLDLESIQALNDGLSKFPGSILFSSHDYQLTQTVANRIIEINGNSYYDKLMSYEEFIDFKNKK
tara:strand:+ start:1527 stop:3119 length:1593 start_codon:yes stop_codon:yes gene_type:complete